MEDHELAGLLAQEAGDVLLAVLDEGLTAGWTPWQLQDQGDRRAHEHLVARLADLRPGDAVLSEEGSDDRVRLASDRVWIIDPLDGTANLIAGLPFYAVAIALIDNLGPRFAAVASCTDGNVWIASRGQGASLNGQPIHLPDTPQSELIVLSTGLLDRLQSFPDAYKSVRSVGKIRNLGSQALHLCSAASGRFAAVASKEARVWDEAAGGLIVREAGGVWHSAADGADWTRPGALMEMEQNSVAGHPASSDAMVRVLGPVLGKVC